MDAMMEASFTLEEHEGVPVLSVTGEIDVYAAPALREQLVDLAAGEPDLVVVDLEKVSFLDSTGLGVLVSALKRLRSSGGDLALVARESPVLRVMAITGLTETFRISDTVAEAVAGRPESR